MRKLFLLVAVVFAAAMSTTETVVAADTSSAEKVSLSSILSFMSEGGDKCLGTVNICDPNGNSCLGYKVTAYQDAENGRIYVTGLGHEKIYAQRSNDNRWPYMVRYSNKWYYFDL